MPDYAITVAAPGDAPACAAIGALFFAAVGEKALQSAAEDGSIFLVAKLDGRVAGYFLALHTLDEGQIVAVAVEENHRRKGVGGQLLYAAAHEGLRRGVAAFYLEVRSGNHAAISLYEKGGLSSGWNQARVYSRPREDAALMRNYRENAMKILAIESSCDEWRWPSWRTLNSPFKRRIYPGGAARAVRRRRAGNRLQKACGEDFGGRAAGA